MIIIIMIIIIIITILISIIIIRRLAFRRHRANSERKQKPTEGGHKLTLTPMLMFMLRSTSC